MKAIYMFLTLTIGLVSCNTITSPAPADPLVPSQVMQLVEKSYQKPQDLVFTELLQNKIWDVRFESVAKKYNLILSPNSIKSAHRLIGPEVPDSLKDLLHNKVIAGGTFSDFREQEYAALTNFNYDNTYQASYFWKGKHHLIRWATIVLDNGLKYVVDMSPLSAQFATSEMGDLPDAIQQYVQAKNYQFTGAWILVANDSKKSYRVWVTKNNVGFQLFFDQDYKLVAGSEQPKSIDASAQLPENIKAYIKRVNESQELGMSVEPVDIIRNEQDGVVSHLVIFRDQKTPTNWIQAWHIIFDQNATPLFYSYTFN